MDPSMDFGSFSRMFPGIPWLDSCPLAFKREGISGSETHAVASVDREQLTSGDKLIALIATSSDARGLLRKVDVGSPARARGYVLCYAFGRALLLMLHPWSYIVGLCVPKITLEKAHPVLGIQRTCGSVFAYGVLMFGFRQTALICE